jgi:hypothetical protein
MTNPEEPTVNRSTSSRTLLVCLAAVTLAAGCGDSGDTESAAEPAATLPDAAGAPSGSEAAPDSDAVTGEAGDGTVRDELTDAMGEQGQTVDDAIAALPAETTWGIVADQLGADDLEIDGAAIRLSFESRTTDDAIFDCIVAASFVQEGQTVTMSYPDGDVVCDQ